MSRSSNVLALTVSGLSLLALASCAGGGSQAPADGNVPTFDGDCSKVTVPTFAEAEAGIFSHCVGCHSSSLVGDARNGAPTAENFDSYGAAKAALPLAVPAVKNHVMPYPNGEGVTEADRNQLYEWALCGTPP